MTGRLYGFCAGILRRISAQKTVFSAQESFAGVLQISEGELNGSNSPISNLISLRPFSESIDYTFLQLFQ